VLDEATVGAVESMLLRHLPLTAKLFAAVATLVVGAEELGPGLLLLFEVLHVPRVGKLGVVALPRL